MDLLYELNLGFQHFFPMISLSYCNEKLWHYRNYLDFLFLSMRHSSPSLQFDWRNQRIACMSTCLLLFFTWQHFELNGILKKLSVGNDTWFAGHEGGFLIVIHGYAAFMTFGVFLILFCDYIGYHPFEGIGHQIGCNRSTIIFVGCCTAG